MDNKSVKKRGEFDPQNYTINDIMSTKSYVIEWNPTHEKRIVSGAYIRGHFKKCKVLSGPYDYPQHALKFLVENA